MNRTLLLLVIFLTGGPLFACAPEVVPIEKPVTAGTLIEEPQAVKKESWQVGWDKTLKEARQEGKVILYSTYPSEARTAISPDSPPKKVSQQTSAGI